MDEHVVPVDTPRQWVRLFVGLAVLLALDAYFIGAAVTTDETKTRVGGIVFAALVTALALFIAVGGAFAVSRRQFVATSENLRFEGGRQPWALRWADIRSVTVQSGYTVAGRRGAGLPRRWRRVATVRLLVELHDLSVAGPLPPKVYRGRWGASRTGFGIPLGPVRELVAPLDAALRATGAGRYAGVADLGEVRGLL